MKTQFYLSSPKRIYSLALTLLITLLFNAPVSLFGQFFGDPIPDYFGLGLVHQPWGVMAPSLVDIDGDGDLDLFVSEMWEHSNQACFNQKSLDYYENIGTIDSPDYVHQGSYPFGIPQDVSILSFVDIDGDGDQDLFSSTCSDPADFLYFQNTGTPTGPVFGQADIEVNPFGLDPSGLPNPHLISLIPIFGDLDGDGDLDVFISGLTGDKFLFQDNVGTPTAPEFGTRLENPFDLEFPFTTTDDPAWLALEDWDCDGDLDILNCIWSLPDTFDLYFHENLGNDTFGAASQTNETGIVMTHGDLDGDGDHDALGYEYFAENITTDCVEQEFFADPILDYFDLGLVHQPYGVMAPALVDIDSDGDLDLFVPEMWEHINQACFNQKSLDYYKNEGTIGSPNFVDQGADPFGIPQDASILSFVDIDGDGDQDLFSSTCSDPADILYFQNTGTPTEPIFGQADIEVNPFGLDPTGLPNPHLISLIPIFGDLDEDGTYDVFISGLTGDQFLFQDNIGTPSSPNFGPRQSDPFGLKFPYHPDEPAWLALEDWDCDGDLDILNCIWSLPATFDLYFHENKYEELGFTSFKAGIQTNDDGIVMTHGDLDGDGDHDALIYEYFAENITTYCTQVSVMEVLPMERIKLYPNPTSDYLYFTLETELSIQDAWVEIHDPLGRVVWQAQLNLFGSAQVQQLDVSALPNGLYTLRLMQEGFVVGKQFVVMKE